MHITIEPLSAERRNEAFNFILPHEHECVNLTERLLQDGEECYAVTESTDGINENSKIIGIFELRKRRTVFHCLPFAKYKTLEDKAACAESQKAFAAFFKHETPFCINGEAAGSLFLKNILKFRQPSMRPRQTNKYWLMTKAAGRTVPANDKGIRQPEFKAARPADFEKLLPLELAYQREEVVPKNYQVSDEALSASFKQNLETEKIFYLEKNGGPIAKLAVTAQGKNYSLVGGVFTKEEFRHQGYGTLLVNESIKNWTAGSEAAKNLSLFVKEQNSAAIHLYEKSSFTRQGEYLIIYY